MDIPIIHLYVEIILEVETSPSIWPDCRLAEVIISTHPQTWTQCEKLNSAFVMLLRTIPRSWKRHSNHLVSTEPLNFLVDRNLRSVRSGSNVPRLFSTLLSLMFIWLECTNCFGMLFQTAKFITELSCLVILYLLVVALCYLDFLSD